MLQGMQQGLLKLAEKIRTEEQQLDMGVPAMVGSDDEFEVDGETSHILANIKLVL